MTPPRPTADDVLTAKGVASLVRERGRAAGHVLLLDYDGGASYERLMTDCQNLPGATFTFESSPGSWHVWNTTVRKLWWCGLRMLRMKCDPNHISVGYRRGMWTLRVGPKETLHAVRDDDREKGPPEPVAWWANPTEREQSEPHLRFVASIFERRDPDRFDADDILARVRLKAPEWSGDAARHEQYLTLADGVAT